MPRRRVAAKRDILPDPKYNSKIVSKFMNAIMESGKKSTAERICYGAFEILKQKTGSDPLKVFKTALEESAAPRIRCLWKSDLTEGRLWLSGGS
jgi:small subunit ribosomal protein S7